MKFKALIIACLLFILSSCVRSIHSDKLITVSIDMDKTQIIKKLGYPSIVRGAIKNNYGQIIEVWEYKIVPDIFSESDAYWLYFCDGNLVKWQQAGNWNFETIEIQNVRFN